MPEAGPVFARSSKSADARNGCSYIQAMNTEPLRHALDRFTHDAAATSGRPASVMAGVHAIRFDSPTALIHDVYRPLVCLVAQGSKRVTSGGTSTVFGAGESLLVASDVPTVSQVLEAGRTAPYLSIVVELDAAILADLADCAPAASPLATSAVRVTPTEAQMADAMTRLLALTDRPDGLRALGPGIVRELHYWVLAGRHGGAVRALGMPGSHAERIARAVALLRRDFAGAISVERLANEAGMSASSFHDHFRRQTSLTPVQFQKQLRLVEARRRMLADGASASSAAFGVGYESISQFTRDYRRLFGAPPLRETRAARDRVAAA
ncbi:AraC family transcriptional regulator [Stakelama pacifica]|nr:AraC family transcriptional regulator [Stakelama pacifica]